MNETNTSIEETKNTENDFDDSSDENKKNLKALKNTKDEITEENCHFTEGELLKFVRVRFPGHAKSYPFLMGKRKLMYGQKVVAMSDRGMAVGYINSFPYELNFSKDMLPLMTINKVASEHDIEREKETYKRQKEIETTCQNLIEKHELDMNLTHVEFTQFGKKVVFYFVAPARVDFRGLVKDLVNDLKLRIELRQISVRDRAASMGALGPCGRELCCSSFLSRYGNVSIKMAKNQNLTLNYSKLNGVCGQLKCCLQYEDEVYENKRKIMPLEASIIKTKTGEIGKVRKLHILTEQFDMLTTRGQIKRYTADQMEKTLKNYTFKEEFDHISDETATVVGLNELQAQRAREFQISLEEIKQKSKIDAASIYNELTGIDESSSNENVEKTENLEVFNLSDDSIEVAETTDSKEVTESLDKMHKKDFRHKKNKRKFNNRNKPNKK